MDDCIYKGKHEPGPNKYKINEKRVMLKVPSFIFKRLYFPKRGESLSRASSSGPSPATYDFAPSQLKVMKRSISTTYLGRRERETN